jgi:hypothetical protein
MRYGCFLVFFCTMLCLGCCCGRVPLFGLCAPVDAEADIQHWLDDPEHANTVDWLCDREQECVRILAYEVGTYPLSWNPLTDTVIVTAFVSGTCALKDGSTIACEGELSAVYGAVPGGWAFRYVTPDAWFADATDSAYLPTPTYSGGGDFDFDDWD